MVSLERKEDILLKLLSVCKVVGISAALFLILVVNREFGVADNGDYGRYMENLASKPAHMDVNWPPPEDEDRAQRFFEQPVMYWSPPSEGFEEAFFSSAAWFFTLGKWLNDFLYTDSILNLKYIGLPFFLLHAIGFLYLFNHSPKNRLTGALVFIGCFFLYTDARVTAFYNSLYAESVMILALFLITAFFLSVIFLEDRGRRDIIIFRTFLALIFFICVAVTLSKRQHPYFLAPALVFLVCIVHLQFKSIRKAMKIAVAGFVAIALMTGGVGYMTMKRGIGSLDGLPLVWGASYHALYYGILPHAENQEELLRKLNLPAESRILIGKNAWHGDTAKVERFELNMGMVLKAIYLDPHAYFKSVVTNAKEVGNFNIPLGMVHGAPHQHPPRPLSLVSSGLTVVSGVYLFCFACLISILLLIRPIGVVPERRFVSRYFSAIMLMIVVLDVVVSTFDGQQEARKHVLAASISCAVILIHAIVCCSMALSAILFRAMNSAKTPAYPP